MPSAMYNSGYSQVSKFSLEAQKKMQHRPKGKSCGYYMRLVFFFSSLIQSLIIVSLVLFLVYGKKQDSASSARIQDLEQSFSRLSMENVALRLQRKNLTMFLNITLTEKARNDWDLAQMRSSANISYYFITELNSKLNQCHMERTRLMLSGLSDGNSCKPTFNQRFLDNCNCGLQAEQMKAMITLVQTNFTQTTQMMRMEMEQIYKDRDNINLEAIRLRREKSVLDKEMAAYRIKCKEDFANSLSGISNVSKAFLEKIDSLFPRHIPFQLTCQKQRENLEQIRSNCTSLSREVENRFQRYLDNVGAQVSKIQTESSYLKAENWRLVEDYSWCSQNRTGLIQEHRQNLQKVQLKYDKEKEQLLMDKMKLSGEKELLGSNLNLKDKEILHLKEQLKQLNFSCSYKTGVRAGLGTSILTQPGSSWNRLNLGGSSSSSSSAGSQVGRTGSTGSSSSSSSSSSSLNKPGLNSIGSSSYGSTGSSSSSGSTGLGSSKPGSNGVSSSSSGSSRFGSSGLGSSSSGSTGSVSTGVGAAKKPSSGVGLGAGQSTGGLGSSSNSNTGGGTGSVVKTSSGSTGWGSWFGTGTGTSSSNTGLNKLGSGLGKGTAGGSSLGGAGSSFGAGRTSGQGVGSNSGTVNISQHLQQLQRIANPTVAGEKKESRLFG